MTPEQIALVQSSMARLGDRSDLVVRTFYDRLFERQPQTRALFPAELDGQREKFLTTLSAIVEALGDFGSLDERARALGARHRRYGARAQHYGAFGEVLVATLADVMADEVSEDELEAWRAAYGLMTELMQQGSAPHPR